MEGIVEGEKVLFPVSIFGKVVHKERILVFVVCFNQVKLLYLKLSMHNNYCVLCRIFAQFGGKKFDFFV